ncbi:MAG: tRNA (adenosine(37)-N6)-dimethylallyltransferase MiaA [Bacillota bacterium]
MHAIGPFIVLVGPTAVGKTQLSIELAKEINAEIVSADSIQIYRYLNIGSAKPTPEEQQGVVHHLIDFVELDEDYSVARFQQDASACIAGILERKRVPLVVGGTGLYVHALTYDVDFTRVRGNQAYRDKLQALADEKGSVFLHAMLKSRDAKRAEAIHENDVKRIIRALEIMETSVDTVNESYDFRKPLPGVNVLMLGITRDRAELYERINKRVDIMIESGLVEEVKGILKAGYPPHLTALQGLGYKEIIAYLQGACTLEAATERIKRDTRRFAKRQLTWFRRDARIRWWDISAYGSQDKVLSNIIDCISKWGAFDGYKRS